MNPRRDEFINRSLDAMYAAYEQINARSRLDKGRYRDLAKEGLKDAWLAIVDGVDTEESILPDALPDGTIAVDKVAFERLMRVVEELDGSRTPDPFGNVRRIKEAYEAFVETL